jgi:hypothetical protein
MTFDNMAWTRNGLEYHCRENTEDVLAMIVIYEV